MPSNSNHPHEEGIYYIHFDYEAAIAAGTDFSVQQNLKARCKLCFVTFTFVTDASAADRKIKIGIEKAGTFIPLGGCVVVHPASTTKEYFFSISNVSSISASDAFRNGSLPDVFCIYDEDYTQSEIDNIQVGDQITKLSLIYACQPTYRYV